MNKSKFIESKIITPQDLIFKLNVHRFLGKKIVFTNGCFDLMHKGHVKVLADCAEFGDILVIGLNSDNSVSRLKGPNRPLQDQDSRAWVIASMHFVDYVVIFDEQTPFELIKLIQPDVLVKGGDYEIENIVGYDIVNQNGGKIITVPIVEGYSTTNIEKKIRSSQ